MSETGSSGVSVPFTAGMVCHCWQAQEGIKGTARLSQRVQLRSSLVTDQWRVMKLLGQVRTVSRQAQDTGYLATPRQGPIDVSAEHLWDRTSEGVTIIAEAGHSGRAYP